MKVKVKKQVEEEMDFDFPVYLETGYSLVKIVSPEKYIKVTNKDEHGLYTYCVEIKKGYDSTIALMLTETGAVIPKEIFTEALDAALSRVNHAAFMELETEPVSHEVFNRNEHINESLEFLL